MTEAPHDFALANIVAKALDNMEAMPPKDGEQLKEFVYRCTKELKPYKSRERLRESLLMAFADMGIAATSRAAGVGDFLKTQTVH